MAIDFHNGKWRVRVTRSGQAHTARFETRDEAESWERQFKAGEVTSAPESASSNLFETTTLKDEIDDYKRRILPSKKKGERQLEVRLDQWASSAFGSKPLASIKLHDVQAWIDAQVSAGKAPSTVNNALGALSNIFAEAARKKGYRNVLNPTKGTRRPRNAPPREVYWTDQMYDALIEAISTATLPWLRPMVLLAIHTGMRQGEIRKQLYRRCYRGKYIVLEDTKNGTRRNVPLSTEARAILDEWLESHEIAQDELLFPVTEAQITNAWRDAWDRAEVRYGVPHVTFHDLRHVALTKLSKKLHNVLELSAVSGHKDLNMLRRYYQPDPDELADRLG